MRKTIKYQNIMSEVEKSTNTVNKTIFHLTTHFSNDFFLAFFAPTLPVLISQLNLLKVQAGILNLGLELTALSMPIIGRIADKKDIRRFMFLTPLVTALCMSSLTIIPNFYLLFFVLFLGGLSIYFYHAIGPADIGGITEKGLGRILAVWNIAGQIGFMLGPLVITAILTNYSNKKAPLMAVFGFLLSIFLYVIWEKLPKNLPAIGSREKEHKQLDQTTRKHIIRQFLPIIGISVTNSLARSSVYTYLPVYIVEKGASLWMSGLAISFYFGAGVIGNYVGGLLHDRIGSKWVTGISILGFIIFFTTAVFATGIFQLFFIAVTGFFGFMLMPAIMAMLQQNNPKNRSLTNGLFLGFTYSITALGSVVTGFMLDHIETQTVFLISAGIGLISIAFIPLLVDEFNVKSKGKSNSAYEQNA